MNVRATKPIFARHFLKGRETLSFVPAGMVGTVSELLVVKGEPVVYVDWNNVFTVCDGRRLGEDDAVTNDNINTVSPADIHYHVEDN